MSEEIPEYKLARSEGELWFHSMFDGNDYNYLKQFWDFDKDECDIEKLSAALPAMSGGEQIMARFFCGVWTGENPLEFDMFQAAKKLDDKQLGVIQKWLSTPEFP